MKAATPGRPATPRCCRCSYAISIRPSSTRWAGSARPCAALIFDMACRGDLLIGPAGSGKTTLVAEAVHATLHDSGSADPDAAASSVTWHYFTAASSSTWTARWRCRPAARMWAAGARRCILLKHHRPRQADRRHRAGDSRADAAGRRLEIASHRRRGGDPRAAGPRAKRFGIRAAGLSRYYARRSPARLLGVRRGAPRATCDRT